LVAATLVGASTVARATTGCGTASAPGTARLDVTSSGQARTVLVHIPSRCTGHDRVPLVLNLHGSGSSAAG
jgi:polyhydroxybutyrate depolymerase